MASTDIDEIWYGTCLLNRISAMAAMQAHKQLLHKIIGPGRNGSIGVNAVSITLVVICCCQRDGGLFVVVQ